MDAILVSPHQVARLEEHLLLLRRMLQEPAPPPRRRGWLLEQCRRRGDDERDLWQVLARYRHTGVAGLLTGTWRRQTAFGPQDALVRERLLTLLLDTPPCLLEQFGLLAPLLQELADRLFVPVQLGVGVVPRTRDAAAQRGRSPGGGPRRAAAEARRRSRAAARDLLSSGGPVPARGVV